MCNDEDSKMLKAYFKAGGMRISRTNILRDDAIKNILKMYLEAGDEALFDRSLSKAERFYHEIIKLASKELRANVPETALAKFNLSTICLERGQNKEAKALAQAAVDIFTELFGDNHPSTGMALHQLAEVHAALNNEEQNKEQNEKAACAIKNKATKILSGHYRAYRRYLDQGKSRELRPHRGNSCDQVKTVCFVLNSNMLSVLN